MKKDYMKGSMVQMKTAQCLVEPQKLEYRKKTSTPFVKKKVNLDYYRF
jgi:hypothetical protein